MKNSVLICLSLLVGSMTLSCEESGNTSLELPFGGRIVKYQSGGTTKSDPASSLWFFKNGCVYLVDTCDSFRLGTIELIGEEVLFSPSSEWLADDHCASSEALVDLLENLSGTYSLSEFGFLTITTKRGDMIRIQGSDTIIDPACPVESIAK